MRNSKGVKSEKEAKEAKFSETLHPHRRFYRHSRRAIWILIACLAGVLVAGLLFWNERQRQARQAKTASDANIERQELAGANLAKIQARVYFRQAGARSLLALQREIFAANSPEVRARQLVQALAEGPQADELGKVVAVLPKETRVRQVYLLKDGTVVIDLSGEAANLLPGGIESEALAMESIQRTLLENVKEIRVVRFLMNGKETETFAGHIAMQGAGEP
ncbi:MAG: GerMN domain-containing protein [Acidobacteria bacterium]|nr:GerMN domain-containing protein [Acidobacteriota bacterium]